MYCPRCKVEYRPGFRRCVDCDVDLVYALPVQAPRKVESGKDLAGLIEVAEGTEFKGLSRWIDSLGCADACLKLRKARIAYRVTEIPKSVGYQMRPQQEFEIAVPTSEFQKAKEILGIQIELGEVDLPTEEEIHAVMELPDEEDVATVERIQDDWDLANWDPEDATVEIWSGDESKGASDKGWIIELALNENRIQSRADILEDGSRHFFVRPGDEGQAREIVREIMDAAPPE